MFGEPYGNWTTERKWLVKQLFTGKVIHFQVLHRESVKIVHLKTRTQLLGRENSQCYLCLSINAQHSHPSSCKHTLTATIFFSRQSAPKPNDIEPASNELRPRLTLRPSHTSDLTLGILYHTMPHTPCRFEANDVHGLMSYTTPCHTRHVGLRRTMCIA